MVIGTGRLEAREVLELTAAGKRYGLEEVYSLGLVYGNTLSDNRTIYVMMPLQSFR